MPYVGAGVGYNRTTMDYADSRSNSYFGFNSNQYNFGEEELITSSINLDLLIGSQIHFTEMFGMNLELQYSRGLGGNLSSDNAVSGRFAPDQARLEDLSAELGESNVVSIFAGMLVSF